MISFDEIRQAIIGRFKTVHDAAHPTITANYPNRFTVDLENYNKSFFVNVSVDFGNSIDASDLTRTDLEIEGYFKVSAISKVGMGSKTLLDYIDTIIANMISMGITGINFGKMRILEVSPYPGYYGQMLSVKFKCIK